MFRKKAPPSPPSEHVSGSASERIAFLWFRGAGRGLRIDVTSDGRVRVHSPAGAPLGRVFDFVAEKAPWILRTQARLRSRTRVRWPAAPRAGDEFLWAGRRLGVEESADRRFSVRIETDRLVVTRPSSGDADRAARRAGRWLRTEAERRLSGRLNGWLPAAARSGLIGGPSSVSRVSFRLMKRRWGSCAPGGRIVLNLRLAQLPEACADYVILHELCHLRHPHHRRAFYNRLARVCPDWKDRRNELERFALA